MESVSQKPWYLTQVSTLLVKILCFCIAVFSITSCNTTNKEIAKFDKLIDSVSSDMNKYYVDLQFIDENKINNLIEKVKQFEVDDIFLQNENVQSSLKTAGKFLGSLLRDRTICLQRLQLNLNQLQESKRNSKDLLISGNKNKLQIINNQQFDETKFQAEYLINRFNAQALLIETLEKAKKDKLENNK